MQDKEQEIHELINDQEGEWEPDWGWIDRVVCGLGIVIVVVVSAAAIVAWRIG